MRMCDTVVLKDAMKVSEAAEADATPRDASTEMPAQNQPPSDERCRLGRKEAPASLSPGHPGRHLKANGKLKLVRSLAVCEESPPLSVSEPAAAAQDGFHLRISQPCDEEEPTASDDGRKENGCDKVDKPERTLRKTLSRDSSQDYTDSTGIDLHEFLVNTLKNNPRDRIMLLKLEQDILDFISNNDSQKRKFPPMTSYYRMLLHRVAAYFGLEHNVDPSGKSVVINKTANTRIPDQKFSDHIKDDRAEDFHKRYILKRDNHSFDGQDCTGDYFSLDGRLQNEETHMSTQQRRQIFRLRAGRSGNSWQSSSETEVAPRHSELRPWSSTDSSDSSHRLAPRPATITKASSFGGTATGLVRGDSTASSSKSTAPLSKTGSGSSSSVASSSSSSLSRPQLPLPAPSRANGVPSAAVSHPATDTRAPGHSEMTKSGPAQPPSAVTTTPSFYLLPLETSGVPAGSFLLNPHTGQAFVSPDGSAAVYNTSTPAPGTTSTIGQQQGKTSHQQTPAAAAAAQQQPANHLLSQPICPSLQPSAQPVQYTAVSHHLPPPHLSLLPSSQFLAVCPNQQYTVPDGLSAQFGHMSLVQQPAVDGGGAQDAHSCPAFYHHPSPLLLQGPPQQQQQQQQVAGYVMAGPPGMVSGQQVPGSAYPSATPGPFPSPGPPLTQQFLQQHAYIQQPVQQVACYCAPAHYPHCPSQQQQQQYRPPVAPLPYNCPQASNMPPQQAYPTMMPNPTPACQPVVGLQPTLNPALAFGSQQSNMGNQMQGMMVQYPPMPSYQQVSVPPGSQPVQQQQQYQQPLVVPCPSNQGAMPMAAMQPYYSLLPPTQHPTMSDRKVITSARRGAWRSSSMGFLPPSAMEQMQFPQASSPCVSQQHLGQQYIGVHPPPPGSGGVFMMQLAVPSGHQPYRTHSPFQGRPSHYKYPILEHQRSRRPTAERPGALDFSQSSIQPVSPATAPSPGHLGSLTALSSIPIMAHHHQQQQQQQQLPPAFCPTGQGEAHYSLLSQPLHYKSSIRPSLLHTTHMMPNHQGPMAVRRGAQGQGRRFIRKGLPSDLCVGDPVSSRILEVTDLPEGISRSEAHGLLGELCQGGAMIKWLSERRQPQPHGEEPRGEGNAVCCKSPQGDLASTYTILATFPSKYAAQSALLRHGTPLTTTTTTFKLRTSNKHGEESWRPGEAGSQ